MKEPVFILLAQSGKYVMRPNRDRERHGGVRNDVIYEFALPLTAGGLDHQRLRIKTQNGKQTVNGGSGAATRRSYGCTTRPACAFPFFFDNETLPPGHHDRAVSLDAAARVPEQCP
jgi:hypothetical protein